MRCPNCYEWISDAYTHEEEYYDLTYYSTMIGTCSKCGKKYKWTEVFTFDDIIEVEEMES